jgi:hypothetical protein
MMFKKIIATLALVCALPMLANSVTSYTMTGGVSSGGGTASPATLTRVGGVQATPPFFDFAPATGFHVQNITGLPAVGTYTLKNKLNGVTVTLPAATGVTVRVAITNLTGPITLGGVFTNTNAVSNAGAGQVVFPGTVVTLNGAASVGATSYTWTQYSGPTVALNTTNPAKPTFTAVTPATYAFRLTVDGGSTATTYVTVTTSTAAAARNSCNNCHVLNNVAQNPNVYQAWSSSNHSRISRSTCSGCHVGTDTGGHPGATVTAANCESCHAATLSTTTHPVATTASKCLVCHDAHDPGKDIANLGPAPAHPAVTLYTFEEIGMQMAGGAKVPVQVDASGKGMPYSPKQTCGTSNCHVKNGVDYTYDKISDHAFHSAQGRNEYVDSATVKFDATKNKPWTQSFAMVGKW